MSSKESDANWRATTSVRSRQRPNVKKSQVWSRLIVVSASPVMAAIWVLMNARYDAGPTRRDNDHWPGSSPQVALIRSHSSTGITWRTARVSRAPR